MGTYVTDSGFQKKTLSEIKTEREDLYKSVFGEDIDLSPEGPFGQIISIESQEESDLWDAMEEIYLSRDPDQTTGVSLTKIARETGTTRQGSEPTIVNDAILYGDHLTTVLIGSKVFRNTDSTTNPVTFSLTADVLISLNLAKEIQLIIPDAIVPSQDYTVTINSTPYTYNAQGGDTKDDVIDELVTLIDALTDFDASNLGEILYIFYAGLSFIVSYSSNMDLEKLGTIGDFLADENGPIAVPANTLTEIINPTSGWDSLNNPNAGTIGINEESDQVLRVRRIQELTAGKATDNSIKTAVANVLNVASAFIISNRTDGVDSGGRPPHSFAVVVTGGDPDDIAQAIFDTQPSGIQSYGSESGTAYDENGISYTIYFSRPTSIYIWVRISRDFNTEETYPTDGDDQMKQAILDYASDFIGIGIDIIRQRLATPIYSISGVGDIIIELAETATPGGTPTYAEDNILVDASEFPEFAESRITVQDIP
jgi:uncharacterized phage protein gp47/JayE